MTEQLTNQDKQDLRHAVLEFLVTRHPTMHRVSAITRYCQRDMPFAFGDTDTASALEVLSGLGWAHNQADKLGSVIYWGATAQGVIAQERK